MTYIFQSTTRTPQVNRSYERGSVKKITQVTALDAQSVTPHIQFNHSTVVSVLLPQSTSTNQSVPLLHKFKNSVTVKIELMLSKPPTNNHYHFPIIVKLVTSHTSDQQAKQEDGWSLSIWRKQLQILLCLACVVFVCVCVCVCVCVGGFALSC